MVRDLKQRFVDGLILVSLHVTEVHAAELSTCGGAGGRDRAAAEGDAVDTVRAYSRRGAAEAVRHLHAVGRRRIAFVNGPPHTVPGASRRLGYLDGLRSCGLARDEELIEVADDFMVEPGRRAAERLLERAQPDAILCANDLLAVGALAALRDCRARRPGRRRGRGDGQHRPLELTWPALTTVDLGSAERARIAAELLLARIEEPGREPRRSSASSRASSCAPRPGAPA